MQLYIEPCLVSLIDLIIDHFLRHPLSCTRSSRGLLLWFPPQLVSLLLIGVAAWGKWFGLVSSIRVVAAVISVGIFLLVVAFVGLCGALKHHQVLLFFVSFAPESRLRVRWLASWLRWFLCSSNRATLGGVLMVVLSDVNFLNLTQYMIVLFLVFIVQLSVSCACLAVNKDQQVCLFQIRFYIFMNHHYPCQRWTVTKYIDSFAHALKYILI